MIKILVAEDEKLSQMTLIHHLRRKLSDALIVGVSNGREAVDRAEILNPQLIFMDIEMPLLNGMEAATIIRKRLPDTVIVFLTAFDRFDYAVGALRAGGNDYLLKPFDKAQIDACLRTALHLEEHDTSMETEQHTPFQIQFSVWLKNHYMNDISLEQAADAMGMSAFYFSRLFRTSYNQTFLEYLTAYRMERAAELLRMTDIPVREIAPLVGYTDANYFSKVFKRHIGETPTLYRQQNTTL
ncbi:MAG TPA: hypothetical protein DDX51_01540 [Clostridiales bacterium]|nr:hypothetical protein [Clostridiales bacterium]